MIDKALIEDFECGEWIERYEPAISQKKKLKFEEGNWVAPVNATGSEKGFKSSTYHATWIWEAFEQPGQIIGRFIQPGSYVKYAVKIPSLHKVYPIHSNFLRKLTEEEIKLIKLVKKLPELEGIF